MVKNLPINAGDAGSIPGSGRSPAGRNGNPLQYFCLENSMDRGAWHATENHTGCRELYMTDYTSMDIHTTKKQKESTSTPTSHNTQKFTVNGSYI